MTHAVFAQDEDAEQEQFKEVPVGEAEEDDSELLTEEVLSDAAGDAEPIVDDIIRVHPLTDIPAPAADVITAVIFPENAKKGASWVHRVGCGPVCTGWCP